MIFGVLVDLSVFLKILVDFSRKMMPEHSFLDHNLLSYHQATSEITAVLRKPIQEGRRLGIRPKQGWTEL